MTVAASATAGKERRSTYIAGARRDLTWVILCPLLVLLGMHALWRWSGLSDLSLYALLFAFVVTGHHMPGWLRAFGEPDVYARNRARLWVAFMAIPALVIVPTLYGFGALALCVGAAFDLWHVAMQQHGFGRIYGAKAGEIDRASARLDLVCVLVWYATVVLWSDAWMQGLAAALRNAGLNPFAELEPSGLGLMRWAILVSSLGLLAAYVARASVLFRRTGRIATAKHCLHVVAFCVLAQSYQEASWYRSQSVQNGFHALQYFFMVWIYSHLSVQRNPERPRGYYRALFGSRRGMVLFAGTIGLYGTGAWALGSFENRHAGWGQERTVQVLGSIVLTSLMLHYYVDSFIWKVRSPAVRRTLAIGGEESGTAGIPSVVGGGVTRHVKGALHAVGYFGIPLALVALVGSSEEVSDPEFVLTQLAHEAELFPESSTGQFELGRALLEWERKEEAARVLRRALALAPRDEGPAFYLAQLAREAGELDTEIRYLEAALDAKPRTPNLHFLLGMARLRRGDWGLAEEALREVTHLDPEYTAAWINLGTAYREQERFELAVQSLERAHALDPDRYETLANLAGALARTGRGEEALALLEEHLKRHPEDRATREFARKLRARH